MTIRRVFSRYKKMRILYLNSEGKDRRGMSKFINHFRLYNTISRNQAVVDLKNYGTSLEDS